MTQRISKRKETILCYSLCGIPYEIRLRGFSSADLLFAKTVYEKYCFKKPILKGRRERVNLTRTKQGLQFKSVWPMKLKLFNEKNLLRPLVRVLFEKAMEYDALILHAAGIQYKGKGIVFPAKSTGGKTTISRLSMRQATIVSDDTLVIYSGHRGYKMYAFPIANPRIKELGYFKKCVRLNKIYFPVKAKTTKVVPLNRVKALGLALAEGLIRVFSRLSQKRRHVAALYVLRFLERVLDRVPYAALHFEKNRRFLRKI